MTTVTAKEARETLSELISRTAYSKEHVVVTRNGKKMAALIPMEEFELLESILDELEYKKDVEEARAALKEVETEGTVSWEKVKSVLQSKPCNRRL